MGSGKIDLLFEEYTKARYIELHKEQFVYFVSLFPTLLIATSGGKMNREEKVTVKKLAEIIGHEFASDDLGEEKEENLTLIYSGEIKFLIKHLEEWKDKFMSALKEYLEVGEDADSIREFISETFMLFAADPDELSEEQQQTYNNLCEDLDIEVF